jgi:hypothetical protein
MLYLEDKQEPEGRKEMLELGRRKDPMSREHLLNETRKRVLALCGA